MNGIAIEPEGGERLERGARSHRVLCELPDMEALELRFGPDFEGVDLHTHTDHTDSFYVISGKAEFTIDGRTMRAGPGGFVAAPSGTVHGFRNAGDGELVLLNFHAPHTGWVARLRGAPV
jgi:mannose-6-phosphate isomerase-like protein (cupin superfamily)